PKCVGAGGHGRHGAAMRRMLVNRVTTEGLQSAARNFRASYLLLFIPTTFAGVRRLHHSPRSVHQSALREAHIPPLPDDDMIEHLDPDDAPRRSQLARDGAVLAR